LRKPQKRVGDGTRGQLISHQKISDDGRGISRPARTKQPAGAREGGAYCGGTEQAAVRDQCLPRGAEPEPEPSRCMRHHAVCLAMPVALICEARPCCCCWLAAAAAALQLQ
jgi:hypothetical protein